MKNSAKIRLLNLKKMSIEELMNNCKNLRNRERQSEVALVAHLSELRNRSSFLDYGYNSIFNYCKEGLGLEDGPSYLRMQVAKVCQKFPIILDKMEVGDLSLTAASKLAPILTENNVQELLTATHKKTVKEVARIVGALNPQKPLSSGVRVSSGKTDISRASSAKISACQPLAEENDGSEISNCKKAREIDLFDLVDISGRQESDKAKKKNNNIGLANSSETYCEPKNYNFRFAAGKELLNQLHRLSEVMNVDNMEKHLPEVIEVAVKIALDKLDPVKKQERREKRKKTAESEANQLPSSLADDVDLDAEINTVTPDSKSKSGAEYQTNADSDLKTKKKCERKFSEYRKKNVSRSRYISPAVRDFTLKRANYQCEKIGINRIRCKATTNLEIDHLVPFGQGGSNRIFNLQALCSQHNYHKAEKEYGVDFIDKKIRTRRKARLDKVE